MAGRGWRQEGWRPRWIEVGDVGRADGDAADGESGLDWGCHDADTAAAKGLRGWRDAWCGWTAFYFLRWALRMQMCWGVNHVLEGLTLVSM